MSTSKDLNLSYPKHLMDPDLYVIGGSKGQSSLVTVFSLWNTMIGSTIVSMPWAVQQAGLVMGMCECYLGVIVLVGCVAFYTCSIIVRLGFSLELYDTPDLIAAMWGIWGRRITVLMSAVLMLGALMAYNVILNSALYKVLDGLSIWMAHRPLAECTTCWNSFSTHYTPFIIMGVLTLLLNMKNKKSYIRLNSKGIYFLITTVSFLIAVGIRALAINKWTSHGSEDK